MDKSMTTPENRSGMGENVHSVKVDDRRISSEALFNKLRELVILHEGEEYKLRITSNNKLILTK